MKLDPSQRAALKALYGTRSGGELKALFALIRALDDKTLLAARAAPRRKPRRGDPLVLELTATLRPILAPAAEKAELLLEHMAKKHRRNLPGEARGLADAARRLRAHFSDAQIGVGARTLLASLARRYTARETVV